MYRRSQANCMTGYTKLFGSIVASTIWREDDATRIVWITMLALANREGVVEASLPGLADLARVSVEDCRRAIKNLEAPDPDSRTKEHEGRRIGPVDGGWLVLNHAKYRAKMRSADRSEYMRIKKQEERARKNRQCQPMSTSVNPVQPIAEAEAEAEGEKKSPQNFEGASPTARLILHEKELGRVTEKMKSIKASYSEHQLMSAADKETFMKLRERKLELQKLLGVTA